MKLTIEIEFGNDAMQRYSQARAVIQDGLGVSGKGLPEVGACGTFRDVNGNRVGGWIVSDSTPVLRQSLSSAHDLMFTSDGARIALSKADPRVEEFVEKMLA